VSLRAALAGAQSTSPRLLSPLRRRRPQRASPFFAASSSATGRALGRHLAAYLGGKSERRVAVRTSFAPVVFTRPTGDLGSQLPRTTRRRS